ncbi:MAG: lytic transglycosylase domain-containing protein [Alkalilacustris sp.]
MLILSALSAAAPILAQSPGDTLTASTVSDIDRYIAEAAQRFGLPPHWIRAVIAVESAGHPRAVSRAGAMGLMQVMPGTWAELRAALGLGSDPFDPRDNILAGTAYLRAMYDRFGSPGFLAAYNAGPGRYAEHLATGRPLPRETRDYVSALAPIITGEAPHPNPPRPRTVTADWRDAPLFAGGAPARSADGESSPSGEYPPAFPGLFVPLQTRRTP